MGILKNSYEVNEFLHVSTKFKKGFHKFLTKCIFKLLEVDFLIASLKNKHIVSSIWFHVQLSNTHKIVLIFQRK